MDAMTLKNQQQQSANTGTVAKNFCHSSLRTNYYRHTSPSTAAALATHLPARSSLDAASTQTTDFVVPDSRIHGSHQVQKQKDQCLPNKTGGTIPKILYSSFATSWKDSRKDLRGGSRSSNTTTTAATNTTPATITPPAAAPHLLHGISSDYTPLTLNNAATISNTTMSNNEPQSPPSSSSTSSFNAEVVILRELIEFKKSMSDLTKRVTKLDEKLTSIDSKNEHFMSEQNETWKRLFTLLTKLKDEMSQNVFVDDKANQLKKNSNEDILRASTRVDDNDDHDYDGDGDGTNDKDTSSASSSIALVKQILPYIPKTCTHYTSEIDELEHKYLGVKKQQKSTTNNYSHHQHLRSGPLSNVPPPLSSYKHSPVENRIHRSSAAAAVENLEVHSLSPINAVDRQDKPNMVVNNKRTK